jgi:hypothetical protein
VRQLLDVTFNNCDVSELGTCCCVTDVADDDVIDTCFCAGARDFKTFKKFVDEHKAKLLSV